MLKYYSKNRNLNSIVDQFCIYRWSRSRLFGRDSWNSSFHESQSITNTVPVEQDYSYTPSHLS